MTKRFGVLALLAVSAALAQDQDRSKQPVSTQATQTSASSRNHKQQTKRHKKTQEANPALSSYLAPYNSGGFGTGYTTYYMTGYDVYGNSGGFFDAYGQWHYAGK